MQNHGQVLLSHNECNKWPYSITKLYYKSDEFKNSREGSVNINGIFSEDHVLGWAYDYARTLGIAISILQPKNGVDVKTLDADKADIEKYFQRIEADTDYSFASHKPSPRPCGNYRARGENLNGCLRRDAAAALTRCFQVPQCEDCVEYECECTHLTELMFPIRLNHEIIAVLITGQIPKNEDQLKKAKEFFGLGSEETQSGEKSDLEPEISVMSTERFNQIKDTLTEAIEAFNLSLDERYERNVAIFQKTAAEYLREIYRKHENGFEQAREEIGKWVKERFGCRIRLIPIPKKNNIEDIRVTVDDIDISVKSSFLDGGSNVQCIGQEGNIYLLSKGTKVGAQERILTCDVVCYCQNNGPEKKPYLVLAIQNPNQADALYHSLIQILLREAVYVKTEEDYRQISQAAQEEKETYENTLSFLTHELGQQVLAAKANMKRLDYHYPYLKPTGHAQTEADWDFLEHFSICETKLMDLDSIIFQIGSQVDTARRLVQDIEIKMENLRFFRREIINPLAANYRVILRGRGMTLVVADSWNANRITSLYSDKRYLPLAIQNILNNAAKYGYPGTRIFYSCCWKSIDNVRYAEIKIVDYGAFIPESKREKIFDRGIRLEQDERVEEQEGTGFGLYFVKGIVQKLGGSVQADSEKICDYSLPHLEEMVEQFQTTKAPYRGDVQLNALKDALEKAREEGYLGVSEAADEADKCVVCTPQKLSFELSPASLYKRGMLPTAKTTFTITLPQPEGVTLE